MFVSIRLYAAQGKPRFLVYELDLKATYSLTSLLTVASQGEVFKNPSSVSYASDNPSQAVYRWSEGGDLKGNITSVVGIQGHTVWTTRFRLQLSSAVFHPVLWLEQETSPVNKQRRLTCFRTVRHRLSFGLPQADTVSEAGLYLAH